MAYLDREKGLNDTVSESMQFEHFFKLFLTVNCQLGKTEQNALLFTKLFKLLPLVQIPSEHQDPVQLYLVHLFV